MKRNGMGSHESARSQTDEWLTPPEIIRALGAFDLDPCAPVLRPWDTARNHYTIEDNGLALPWHGRVWMNPPYGRQTGTWLDRLAQHGDGVALVFARTETRAFFENVWGKATAILFIRGRLAFYDVTGKQANNNGGAPSALIAYGNRNAAALLASGIPGAYVLGGTTV